MDRKRTLAHLGLILLPLFVGTLYYALIFSSRALKALDVLFSDNPADREGLFELLTNLAPIFEIACLGIVAYSAYVILTRKPDDERREVLDSLILGILAFLATSVSLLILTFAFIVSVAVVRGIMTPELAAFLESLKGEYIFMIPLSALLKSRSVLLYLLAILFPLSVFLCISSKTRVYGKIMLEQTFIWTFVSDTALILLLAVFGAVNMLKPLISVSPLFYAVPAAAAVIISPLVLLKALEYSEKASHASSHPVKKKKRLKKKE